MTVELVRTVNPEDVRKILAKPRDIELAAKVSSDSFMRVVLRFPTTGGTLIDDGELVGAAGITRLHYPYAFVWLVASRDIKPYMLAVTREIRVQLAQAKEERLRLCTNITPGLSIAERFATALGFKKTPAGYWELTNEL